MKGVDDLQDDGDVPYPVSLGPSLSSDSGKGWRHYCACEYIVFRSGLRFVLLWALDEVCVPYPMSLGPWQSSDPGKGWRLVKVGFSFRNLKLKRNHWCRRRIINH